LSTRSQGIVTAWTTSALIQKCWSDTRLLASSSVPSTSSAVTDNSDNGETTTHDDNNNPLGLTSELDKLTTAFASIGDDKLRYKQLLYMANQLAPMDDALKTPSNLVPGCLSTVHVHASLVASGDAKAEVATVTYQGDSDGLLTKGLVALLVRGLSGNTPEDIQKVDPKFIETAGISASLTPGRNNGFLNMLAVMKQQAKALTSETSASAPSKGESVELHNQVADVKSSSGSKYDAMLQALQMLKPTHIDLVDNSHQHAGHAGNDMDGESHFDLYIVSEAFEGLNLVKRHKLVYMMLGEIMPRIHALQIRAQTPTEAAK
jgi:sulfur transfer protein SufE/stress-induced morphogen